jgi:predicted O-methyltransferase YrrM
MTEGFSNLIGRFSNLWREKCLQNDRVVRFLSLIYRCFVFQNIIAIPLLRKKANRFLDTAEIVDFCQKVFTDFPYIYFGWRISPLQIPEEMTKLLEITKNQKPEYLLEIGTALGGTLFSFSRTANSHATLISVDLPGGKFGSGYPIWRIPYYKSFASKYQKIRLLRRSSHDLNTLNMVKGYLNNAQLDVLFIDGDHTYKGVKQDFELYSSLVRKGGLVVFHDVANHPPETGVEVNRFWSEIKQNFSNQEIIKDPNQGGAGIGILLVS